MTRRTGSGSPRASLRPARSWAGRPASWRAGRPAASSPRWWRRRRRRHRRRGPGRHSGGVPGRGPFVW
ncbi:MAG: hypothetical protein EOP73_01915 [Variovorax sp.]|nr:MAG: hypothetical protein EOP73_01915 [Variovorax sp.]